MSQEKEKDFWDSLAGGYDRFVTRFAHRTYARILHLIKQQVSASPAVLEIGTGTGLIALAIADSVRHISAIDYSEGMIKIAREQLRKQGFRHVDFRIGDARQIDYPDHTFDVVIASNVFHLLAEPEQVLQEVSRVLTERGKVILPTYCHGQNVKSRAISALMSLSGFRVRNKWSVSGFRTFIAQCGYHIEKEEIIRDRIPLLFIVATKTK